ncbi:MAG: DUF2520 domain-containing protein [Chitinophagaceae bacterium]|nr:MAG: DUF2520 domain-containing protein [Chitinophagaceae bacterium]
MKPLIHILGNGNVAQVLAVQLTNSGYSIQSVYARKKENANEIQTLTGAVVTDKISDIEKMQGIVFFALSDTATAEFCKRIKFKKDVLAVHTSGTLPDNLLAECSADYAVFYPFQSIHKTDEGNPFKGIPVGIYASKEESYQLLSNIAFSLSAEAFEITEKQRKVLHLSGVLSNNFTTFLINEAAQLLKINDLNPNLIAPLIKKTLNIPDFTKKQLPQTGPAIRNDKEIIREHLKLLEKDHNLSEVYEMLTKSIRLRIKDNSSQL